MIHSSIFVCTRLVTCPHFSILAWGLFCTRLVTCLHSYTCVCDSSTFVYTRLDSSGDSSVFLEYIPANHLLLSHIKLFYKTKRGLEPVSLPHFLHHFWRKTFLLLYSIAWPNCIVWLPLVREISSNLCIAIVFQPDCDAIHFEISLIFLIRRFFLYGQKLNRKL